jgi:hypothetical protein
MTTLAVALNLGWIPLPLFTRGGVNVAIGAALISSSFAYVR